MTGAKCPSPSAIQDRSTPLTEPRGRSFSSAAAARPRSPRASATSGRASVVSRDTTAVAVLILSQTDRLKQTLTLLDVIDRGPRLLHEADVRLDQGFHPPFPSAVVGEPHLLAQPQPSLACSSASHQLAPSHFSGHACPEIGGIPLPGGALIDLEMIASARGRPMLGRLAAQAAAAEVFRTRSGAVNSMLWSRATGAYVTRPAVMLSPASRPGSDVIAA